MKPKQSEKAYLTNRDHKLLISLFQNKIMSFDQISRVHFNGRSQGVVSRRLSKLKSIGLINKKSYSLNGRNCSLFEITKFGLSEVKEYLIGEVKFNNFKSDSIVHDIELVDMANRFESLKQVKKIHFESELRSYSVDCIKDELLPFSALKSDLALELHGESTDEFVAFEYERTGKSRKRNEQKLDDYYSRKSIKAVFYSCEDKSVLKALMKVDRLLFDKYGFSKMYFCLREEFYKNEDQITFSRFDGEEITIL